MKLVNYKIRKYLKRTVKFVIKLMALCAVLFVLGYVFNNLIYGKLIWEDGIRLQNIGDCNSSVKFYNYAVDYFSKTDFIDANKEKYISVQYKKAMCYLKLKNVDEADKAIKEGMYLITDSYGVKSVEYTQYVGRYVVDYYIQKRDFVSAKNYLKLAEYLCMKAKANKSDIAQINRLYGDMYFAMGKKTTANIYYLNAYRMAEGDNDINIDSLITITHRVGDMYNRDHLIKNTIKVYSKLLDTITKRNCKDKGPYAYVKWLLGNAYAKEGNYDAAVGYYEDAYAVLLKLPSRSEYFVLKQNINQLRFDMIRAYNVLGRKGAAEKLQNEINKSSGKKG